MRCSPYLAELIASFALVFIGAGSVLANNLSHNSIGVLGIALAHGIALICMTYAVFHISGAHLNPAITLGLWVAEKMSTIRAAVYIVAQLIGAALAGFLLKVVFINASADIHLGAPVLGSGVTFLGGVVIEAFLAFFLVFTYFAVAADSNKYEIGAVGLAYACVIIVGYLLTGAAVNPARAFGPALASGFFTNQLVYWIGPIVGSVVAALLYNALFIHKDKRVREG